MGPVAQPSRSKLRESVRAFRCQLAVNDSACDAVYGANTRSKFDPFADEETQASSFDATDARALYNTLFGGIASALAGKDQMRAVLKSVAMSEPFLHKNVRSATESKSPEK